MKTKSFYVGTVQYHTTSLQFSIGLATLESLLALAAPAMDELMKSVDTDDEGNAKVNSEKMLATAAGYVGRAMQNNVSRKQVEEVIRTFAASTTVDLGDNRSPYLSAIMESEYDATRLGELFEVVFECIKFNFSNFLDIARRRGMIKPQKTGSGQSPFQSTGGSGA